VELEFEWDEEKARTNLAKHRVSFLTAAEISPTKFWSGSTTARTTERFALLRLAGSMQMSIGVVFTWRSESLIRIISAQKASRDEREIYHRQTLPE
jgi:uncharacterized DUF497 family protein